ncbi:MAG: restriction endonuclease subunit S, partial [Aliarcobacter sp.]|nr:restriction endonuclease subunit S [Aliarcobacter sp.]
LIFFPIPSKEEQKAIAKALSDTDELITTLEKLISKKEAIKQGTMQQLLTGKKRLSGFTGEWEEKSLEEVVENAGLVRGPFGGALKKEFFVSKGYKVYEQRNAIYKSIEIGSYYIDEEKFQELKRFELSEGDLIVSCSGTIGKIYEIPKNAPKGIINQALLKIKLDNKKIDTNFFLYIFSSNDFQSKIIDNSHGGAMPNLVGMDTFKKTIIHIPKLKEQQAIAGILSDMNKEIDTLKQKLSKTKAIKDGIMSELLTGKTRLKVKDE